MLHLVNLEEIQDMLLRIPPLVDLQEQQDPNFVQETKQWLVELEKVFNNNRLSAAGIIAALRGELISSERGVIPAGIEHQGRVTRRKIREATAAYIIRQTGELVSSVIQRDQERVAEGELLVRQLVSIAKVKGLIKELPSGENAADILKHIWRKMSADADLSPGTTNVEGLMGPFDALIVLDRVLTIDTPNK